MKQYVFSRTMERSPDPNVELISERAADLVRGRATRLTALQTGTAVGYAPLDHTRAAVVPRTRAEWVSKITDDFRKQTRKAGSDR